MGRRQERRQGSSRRVKIDLSVQEQGSSPPRRENRGDGEAKESNDRAHSSPPHTSGTSDNPLGLLGQYSDDEKVPAEGNQIDAKVKDFIADLETSGLLDGSIQEEKAKPETGANTELVAPLAKAAQVETSSAPKAAVKTGKKKLVPKRAKRSSPAEGLVHELKWKAILDEASGDYYYWNTETGEATWDKPDSFSVDETLVTQAYTTTGYESYTDTAPAHSAGFIDFGGTAVHYSSVYPESECAYPQSNDPAAVIQLGETIAHRFKLLVGDALLQLPARVRFCIEAEIRLSDCKSFASTTEVGSVFWMHAEAELKRLETLLGSEEAEVAQETKEEDMEVDMDLGEEVPCTSGRPLPSYETENTSTHQNILPPPPDNDGTAPLPPELEIPPPPPDDRPAPEEDNQATTSGNASPEAPSSAVLVAEAAAAAKSTAKLTRLRKRSASLKSNKKISSLVNKWNAAKEELHESDSEDTKVLYDPDALERKRQREIEEWRREQIASGQALDNANFQPLGGVDWRERVKRAKKEPPKAPTKPNLERLSKGLAPGWKAYFDEKSGDVYYANAARSETTWDKPVA